MDVMAWESLGYSRAFLRDTREVLLAGNKLR